MDNYTPNGAIQGDMGWPLPIYYQWVTIVKQWQRLHPMSDNRINKKVFMFCKSKSKSRCKLWYGRVDDFFKKHDLHMLIDINVISTADETKVIQLVKNKMLKLCTEQWSEAVNKVGARSGNGPNKLRTYCTFKNIFQTEFYVENIMTRSHRSALAKFRCGVAPIRLKTGRYEKSPGNERFCSFCLDCIEDECHVILECPVYSDMRVPLLEAVFAIDSVTVHPKIRPVVIYPFK